MDREECASTDVPTRGAYRADRCQVDGEARSRNLVEVAAVKGDGDLSECVWVCVWGGR